MNVTKKGLMYEEAMVNSGLMDEHVADGIKLTQEFLLQLD